IFRKDIAPSFFWVYTIGPGNREPEMGHPGSKAGPTVMTREHWREIEALDRAARKAGPGNIRNVITNPFGKGGLMNFRSFCMLFVVSILSAVTVWPQASSTTVRGTVRDQAQA